MAALMLALPPVGIIFALWLSSFVPGYCVETLVVHAQDLLRSARDPATDAVEMFVLTGELHQDRSTRIGQPLAPTLS